MDPIDIRHQGYQIFMKFRGTTVLLPVEMPDGADEFEQFERAVAYFTTKGFTLPNDATDSSNAQGGNAQPTYQRPQQRQQPQQQSSSQWKCPVHGTSTMGNFGIECGTRAVGTVPAWRYRPGKDKQTGEVLPYTFLGRDGQPVFCCAERPPR
jgi:hypothetical protein